MEKIKISNQEFNIVSILKSGSNLLKIEFPEAQDLSSLDKSSIEVYTSGGVKCATLNGYTTIYKTDGNTVILSNDGSVYKISALLVDTDGFVVDNVSVAEDEITQFTITEPIRQTYWKAKWNFILKQWEEGGTAPEPPEPTEPQPTIEERLDELATQMTDAQVALCEIYESVVI